MKRSWSTVIVQCLIVVAAISMGLAIYAFQRVETLEERVERVFSETEDRIQALDTLVEFDSRRQTLLLALRDRIFGARGDLGYDKAYEYASLAVEAADKYPSVDPALLVSIGVVESGYDPRAKSPAGALGLYQIIPATGRLLTRSLGWEYADAVLYDPRRNTEMAALYLEVLFAAYNDPRMVLAEYNGGPLNAGYLRAGVNRLSSETREYVDKVVEVYEGLKVKLDGEMAANGLDIGTVGETSGHRLSSRLTVSVKSSLGALKEADHPTTPLGGR